MKFKSHFHNYSFTGTFLYVFSVLLSSENSRVTEIETIEPAKPKIFTI